jgi:hypothetical protein
VCSHGAFSSKVAPVSLFLRPAGWFLSAFPTRRPELAGARFVGFRTEPVLAAMVKEVVVPNSN